MLVLINFVITLRIVRWFKTVRSLQEREAQYTLRSELTVGHPVPDFIEKLLTGDSVQLSDYLGHSVVFVFVSPRCVHCRLAMPTLIDIDASMRRQSEAKLVLVSSSSIAETKVWFNTINQEDGVEVKLPTIIAPRNKSKMHVDYNPRGLSPYYCFINEQGVLQSRDPLDSSSWENLKRFWMGKLQNKSYNANINRYR